MAEKAVDETGKLAPINAFNVVTHRNHSSPTPNYAAGRSVFARVLQNRNLVRTPGGQQTAPGLGQRRTRS